MQNGRIQTSDLFISYFTAHPKQYFYILKSRGKWLKQFYIQKQIRKTSFCFVCHEYIFSTVIFSIDAFFYFDFKYTLVFWR